MQISMRPNKKQPKKRKNSTTIRENKKNRPKFRHQYSTALNTFITLFVTLQLQLILTFKIFQRNHANFPSKNNEINKMTLTIPSEYVFKLLIDLEYFWKMFVIHFFH